MKQTLALFLALAVWVAIRAHILLTYWNANPRKLMSVAAIPAVILLTWWLTSETDFGIFGFLVVVLVAADGFVTLARLVRLHYGQAVDVLKQPHRPDEASR